MNSACANALYPVASQPRQSCAVGLSTATGKKVGERSIMFNAWVFGTCLCVGGVPAIAEYVLGDFHRQFRR